MRILLVEDDSLIRLATAEMLADLGHTVADAADGGTALKTLDDGVFDVIVTDLSLPGMSGEEFAVSATRRRPELRVVFATGHAAFGAGRRKDGLEGAVVLQKPYDEKSMAAALSAAMAASE